MFLLWDAVQLLAVAIKLRARFFDTVQRYMATKSPTNSAELRRLYAQHKAGNRHATARLAATVKRAPARSTKSAPKTTAHRVVTPRAALRPSIEHDDGTRLMAARNRWQDLKTAAHRLVRVGTRNLTAAELRFVAAVRTLPSRAPTQASTLREWRHFAKLVEAANLKAPRAY